MEPSVNLERIRSVFERSGVALSLSDLEAEDTPLVLANAKFEALTGYPLAETEGTNCRFLQDPDDPANVTARGEIRDAIAARRECQVILRNRRKSGEMFDNLLFLHVVGGDRRYMLGSQFELTAGTAMAQGASEHANYLMSELERIGQVSARLQMQGRRHLAEAAAAMVTAWARRT